MGVSMAELVKVGFEENCDNMFNNNLSFFENCSTEFHSFISNISPFLDAKDNEISSFV